MHTPSLSSSNQNITENMDMDMFISEIEVRPAIWDMRSDLYSNRIEKTKSWEEMCLKFIPGFNKKGVKEKNIAVGQLQRKWKSLRDCYNRERAKQKNTESGSGASSRRKYIYFQQLSFLSVLAATRPTFVEAKQERRSSILPPATRSPGKRKHEKDVEKLQLLENSGRVTQKECDDPDRSFLLSLLPNLRSIHEDVKLDIKMEILGLFRKYRNAQIDPLSQPHYGFNHQSSIRMPSQQYAVVTSRASPEISQDINTPSPACSITPPHSVSDDSTVDDVLK